MRIKWITKCKLLCCYYMHTERVLCDKNAAISLGQNCHSDFHSTWLLMIAGKLATCSSLTLLNEWLQSTPLLPRALQVVVSLTLWLVLCYDGYRLPRSFERSRSLLVGSTAEINAVHLRREPRQQQLWAAWHYTGRQKGGSKYPMDGKVRWMPRCRSRVQNQKGWEKASYDQQRGHTPVPLTP